jgi:hypothetical protein
MVLVNGSALYVLPHSDASPRGSLLQRQGIAGRAHEGRGGDLMQASAARSGSNVADVVQEAVSGPTDVRPNSLILMLRD